MKSSKTPLERKRPLFFLAGLVFALSITLVSFEWRTPYHLPEVYKPQPDIDRPPIELPPITSREEKREIARPKLPQKPIETTQMDIVENDVVDAVDADEPQFPDEADLPSEVASAPEADEPEEDEIFMIVEEMPNYPGGEGKLLSDLTNRTEYPQIAKDMGTTGIVYVSYVVDKEGNVVDVRVARGVDPFLDKEAVRVVKTLKGYKPGKQRGRPVSVQFTVPIRFVLQ
ncbi:MAG: TonB family protein [Flavobacteriales bacterium]|nr:TonB family protein [Flavobacteriales bacterium]